MFAGSIILVSIFVVVIRRHFFRKKLADVVAHSAAGKKALEDIEHQESQMPVQKSIPDSLLRRRRPAQEPQPSAHPISRPRRSIHYGHGTFPAPWEIQGFRGFFAAPFQSMKKPTLDPDHQPYLSFKPKIDDKGRVHALTEYERAELGGVEYRALGVLMWALAIYQVFWMLLGAVFLVPYMYHPSVKSTIADSQSGNLNPGFFGFFFTSTSFTNCGLNIIDANLVSFRGFYLILIVAAALTYAGNTQFPIFLRFGLWLTQKCLPDNSRLKHTLRFLLHHPRRCFIWLFPARETWILFAIQWSIEFILWFCFEVLNIGLSTVTEAIPVRPRVIDGLFQATGVRTSGTYIIVISALAPALLVVYLVFIYMSSFPVIMTLRQTNTYEERSVGIDPHQGEGGGLAVHIRNQLAYDMWFQMIAWILICTIERPQIAGGAEGFTLFAVLFEVVSGYGTVGLSTGVPYDDYSLSGQFHTLSKIIMLVVMLRGRHRGLPLAIDRSILLPGQDLMHEMDEEYSRFGEFTSQEERDLRQQELDSAVKETQDTR